METINENAFATAYYQASEETVYYTFSGPIRLQLGLETLRSVMTFATQRRVKAILSDLSQTHGTFTGANEFFEKEYYPHMIKHGLRCTAIVVPNDVFTRFAANELKKKAGDFQLQIFDDKNAALHWIHAVLAITRS
jgi:hypothetical protein